MLLKEAEENDEADEIDNDTEMVSCISSPVFNAFLRKTECLAFRSGYLACARKKSTFRHGFKTAVAFFLSTKSSNESAGQ